MAHRSRGGHPPFEDRRRLHNEPPRPGPVSDAAAHGAQRARAQDGRMMRARTQRDLSARPCVHAPARAAQRVRCSGVGADVASVSSSSCARVCRTRVPMQTCGGGAALQDGKGDYYAPGHGRPHGRPYERDRDDPRPGERMDPRDGGGRDGGRDGGWRDGVPRQMPEGPDYLHGELGGWVERPRRDPRDPDRLGRDDERRWEVSRGWDDRPRSLPGSIDERELRDRDSRDLPPPGAPSGGVCRHLQARERSPLRSGDRGAMEQFAPPRDRGPHAHPGLGPGGGGHGRDEGWIGGSRYPELSPRALSPRREWRGDEPRGFEPRGAPFSHGYHDERDGRVGRDELAPRDGNGAPTRDLRDMRELRERDDRDAWSAHDGRDERERMERGDARDGRAPRDGRDARRFEAPRPRDMRDREWDARDFREPWQGAADWGRDGPDLHARRELLDRRDPLDRERETRERLGRDAGDHSWDRRDGRLDTDRVSDRAHRHFAVEGGAGGGPRHSDGREGSWDRDRERERSDWGHRSAGGGGWGMSSRVTMPGAFGGDTRDGRDARDARDESLQDHGHHHAGPGASRPRSRSKSERSEDSGRDGRKDGARDSGAESGREGARDGGRPPWSPSRGYPPPGQPASPRAQQRGSRDLDAHDHAWRSSNGAGGGGGGRGAFGGAGGGALREGERERVMAAGREGSTRDIDRETRMGGGRGDSVGWGSLAASGSGRASGVGWGSLAGGVRTGGGHSDVGQEGMLPNGREAVDMGLTGVERDRRHDMARERAVEEGEAGQGGDRKAGRDREAEADQEKGRGVEMEREGEGAVPDGEEAMCIETPTETTRTQFSTTAWQGAASQTLAAGVPGGGVAAASSCAASGVNATPGAEPSASLYAEAPAAHAEATAGMPGGWGGLGLVAAHRMGFGHHMSVSSPYALHAGHPGLHPGAHAGAHGMHLRRVQPQEVQPAPPSWRMPPVEPHGPGMQASKIVQLMHQQRQAQSQMLQSARNHAGIPLPHMHVRMASLPAQGAPGTHVPGAHAPPTSSLEAFLAGAPGLVPHMSHMPHTQSPVPAMAPTSISSTLVGAAPMESNAGAAHISAMAAVAGGAGETAGTAGVGDSGDQVMDPGGAKRSMLSVDSSSSEQPASQVQGSGKEGSGRPGPGSLHVSPRKTPVLSSPKMVVPSGWRMGRDSAHDVSMLCVFFLMSLLLGMCVCVCVCE